MSDIVDEGKQEELDTQGADVQSPSAQPLPDLDALKSEVSRIVRAEVEALRRELQSDKDRRLPKLEQRADNLEKQIERILALANGGRSPDQIARELVLDEIIEQARNVQPAEGSATPKREERSGVQDIIVKAGLSPSDPEVVAALSGVSDPITAALRVGELVARKKERPTPTPAQSPASQQQPPAPETEERLIAELQSLQSDPVRNWKRIQEITAKLGW